MGKRGRGGTGSVGFWAYFSSNVGGLKICVLLSVNMKLEEKYMLSLTAILYIWTQTFNTLLTYNIHRI